MKAIKIEVATVFSKRQNKNVEKLLVSFDNSKQVILHSKLSFEEQVAKVKANKARLDSLFQLVSTTRVVEIDGVEKEIDSEYAVFTTYTDVREFEW